MVEVRLHVPPEMIQEIVCHPETRARGLRTDAIQSPWLGTGAGTTDMAASITRNHTSLIGTVTVPHLIFPAGRGYPTAMVIEPYRIVGETVRSRTQLRPAIPMWIMDV